MEFKVHAPSAILQPFIQCYVEADCRNTQSGTYPMFPNGLTSIFFNFGKGGRIVIESEQEPYKVCVSGQIDIHFLIGHDLPYYSIGVLFKPTAMSWLLKLNMAEIRNKVVDGSQLSDSLSSLHQQIEEAESIENKIKAIDAFFTSVVIRRSPPETVVDFALNILHHEELVSMKTLAQKLNISQRHLETQFRQNVGLSPKTYSLVIRFKRMEEQIRKMQIIHWRDMPFAGEYYDQTHFIKDFKRFTGITPSAYLLEKFEMGRSWLQAKLPADS